VKNITCFILFLLPFCTLKAQQAPKPFINITGTFTAPDSSNKVRVREIKITGTKKTKPYIVLREMQFKEGDSLSVATLHDELEKARQQVYNTTLFDEVNFNAVVNGSDDITVDIRLKERWYIYPVPQFQLVDRNLNDWWSNQKRSFDRVNYGVKFVHYNLSGRRDQLRIFLINGYSRNISFNYYNPYSNKKLTAGFFIGGGYTQNREIAYKTDTLRLDSNTLRNDQLIFYPLKAPGARVQTGSFVRNSWYINAGYTIRRGLFRRHTISAAYSFLKVDDSVVTSLYNPKYFNKQVNSIGYLDLSYIFQYTNLNNNSYPLKGLSGYFAAIKRGFGWSGGINMFSLEGSINKYIDFKKGWYGSFQLNGKIKLPFEQAYINQRALGYGENYLRGLEKYVVDGVATGLLRTTLKKKIVAFNVPFPFFPRLLTRIPFSFYAKAYGDLGYSYNKKQYYSYLNDRMLYTGGFGIDLVTLYDVTFRFEYSFNQLGERGFFFHTQNGF